MFNDQAYFVMLFAQLEDSITQKFCALVKRKRVLKNWRTRRPWQIIDIENIDRVPFMNRLSLLMDKGIAEYARIKKLYGIRCDIAHGQVGGVTPMNLPVVAQEIQRLAKMLKS